MKAIAGAGVLLSGAVLFAGGAVANAILVAAQQWHNSEWFTTIPMVVGALVGLAGLVLLGIGWKSEPLPR